MWWSVIIIDTASKMRLKTGTSLESYFYFYPIIRRSFKSLKQPLTTLSLHLIVTSQFATFMCVCACVYVCMITRTSTWIH